jgi:hypothetical protein
MPDLTDHILAELGDLTQIGFETYQELASERRYVSDQEHAENTETYLHPILREIHTLEALLVRD